MAALQPLTDPWEHCLNRIGSDIPQQQFNTWIRPLQAQWQGSGLMLAAPNRFIRDFVTEKYVPMIATYLLDIVAPASAQVSVTVVGGGAATLSQSAQPVVASPAVTLTGAPSPLIAKKPSPAASLSPSNLVAGYTFERFVEGKSNQLALAAAQQVSEHPGDSYNPLFLYGGVGLGKTHLMHAVGNAMRRRNPDAKIVYLHSERFVADMVKALQLNAINDFKRFYRSVDALLIDDIQFFANKDRSQEEFFHTFNALLEGGQQMILTCDRYPREIDGVEERLKSRFGWGLTVAVEPPDLETRVAILMKKAEQSHITLAPAGPLSSLLLGQYQTACR